MELHPTDTANYRDNLQADPPRIWVVLREAEAPPGLRLCVVTVDAGEAHLYADVGTDLLESLPMPAGLRSAVEAFVAQHHVERVLPQAPPRPRGPGRPRRAAAGAAALRRRTRIERGTAKASCPAGRGGSARSGGPRRRPRRGSRADRGCAAAGRAGAGLRSRLPAADREPDAESDFAAFLREEVPAALRRAALRRAWTLDPAIRDFVGPADYAWDFNAPDGVPGFSLDLGGDVERLIAQAVGLGEAPAEAKAGEAPPLPAAVAETVAPPSSPPSLPDHALEAPPPVAPASPDVASRPRRARGRASAAGRWRRRRRHGGALPS